MYLVHFSVFPSRKMCHGRRENGCWITGQLGGKNDKPNIKVGGVKGFDTDRNAQI